MNDPAKENRRLQNKHLLNTGLSPKEVALEALRSEVLSLDQINDLKIVLQVAQKQSLLVTLKEKLNKFRARSSSHKLKPFDELGPIACQYISGLIHGEDRVDLALSALLSSENFSKGQIKELQLLLEKNMGMGVSQVLKTAKRLIDSLTIDSRGFFTLTLPRYCGYAGAIVALNLYTKYNFNHDMFEPKDLKWLAMMADSRRAHLSEPHKIRIKLSVSEERLKSGDYPSRDSLQEILQKNGMTFANPADQAIIIAATILKGPECLSGHCVIEIPNESINNIRLNRTLFSGSVPDRMLYYRGLQGDSFLTVRKNTDHGGRVIYSGEPRTLRRID